MHTFEHTTNDGVNVVINHNGDYSGDAKVRISTAGGDAVSVEIPCEALVAFCGEAVKDILISALEQTDTSSENMGA